MEFVVMFSMCPDAHVAESIARHLVDERLAACGNVVPGGTSVYRWRGVVHTEPEVLLTLKTRASLVADCVRRIRALHPYELPEIVAVPIIGGLPAYLDWIRSETRGARRGDRFRGDSAPATHGADQGPPKPDARGPRGSPGPGGVDEHS